MSLFAASSFLPVSYESAKACAVLVEDSEAKGASEKKASASASIAASNNVIPSSTLDVEQDVQQPRNLPPDGTTFNQISLLGPKQRQTHTLPAYGYW